MFQIPHLVFNLFDIIVHAICVVYIYMYKKALLIYLIDLLENI